MMEGSFLGVLWAFADRVEVGILEIDVKLG